MERHAGFAADFITDAAGTAFGFGRADFHGADRNVTSILRQFERVYFSEAFRRSRELLDNLLEFRRGFRCRDFLAEELARRQLGVRWCAFFRPQATTREELLLLKRSGMYAIEVGTDAASDTTLAELRKGFTFSDVVAFSHLCSAEEIPSAHFVTFGGPGETPETLREGLGNLDRLGECVVFGFTGLRIYPCTALHDRAVHDGLLSPTDPLLKPAYYFSPHIDVTAMDAEVERLFRPHRGRFFPPSEGTDRLHVMHRFGYRGILWDTLLPFAEKASRVESKGLPGTTPRAQRS